MFVRLFIFKILYIILFPILQITINSCVAVTQVNCELKWIPDSLRPNPPKDAVSFVKGEYIARVNQGGLTPWISGRMLHSEKVAIVPVINANATLVTHTYSILTNPNNCILEWVDFDAAMDVVPDSVVWVNGWAISNIVVARGNLNGRVLSGHLNILSGRIVIPSENEYVVHQTFGEILTSVYPPLEMTVSNIRFSYNLIDEKSKSICIAKEEYRQDVFRLNTYATKLIVDHQKRIMEEFRFTERDLIWKGVERVNLNVGLWYDSADFSTTFDLSETGSELIFTKEKHLRSVKEYTIPLAPVETNIPHLEFCTVANIVSGDSDSVVDFTGIAKYTARGMKKEDIKNILDGLGRTYDNVDDGDHPTKFVTGTVRGIMRGKYVLSLATFAANIKTDAVDPICRTYCVPDTIPRKYDDEL